MSTERCPRCHGCRWVCVDHPMAAWDEGCEVDGCGAEGVACICNPEAEMPPGFQGIASLQDEEM